MTHPVASVRIGGQLEQWLFRRCRQAHDKGMSTTLEKLLDAYPLGYKPSHEELRALILAPQRSRTTIALSDRGARRLQQLLEGTSPMQRPASSSAMVRLVVIHARLEEAAAITDPP